MRIRVPTAQRGYGARWQKVSRAYLLAHPDCVRCEKQGVKTPARVVDHIIPHKGDWRLMWDMVGNWQALCKRCHDVKTATEDGGFGSTGRA